MRLLPLAVLIYAAIIPLEARLVIAGQNIYPPRLVELLALPWLIQVFARGLFPYRFVDLAMIAAASWMVFSFGVFYGSGDGLRRGIPLALDTLVPYLIARYCIRDITDLRRLLVMTAPAFFAAGLGMALESLTHIHLVKPPFIAVFGALADYEGGVAVGEGGLIREVRLGLLRSAGPFTHPIIAGVVMASLLPIYFWSGLRGWPRLIGVIAGCCAVFSVSSGAFMMLLIILAFVAFDWIQRRSSFLTWGHFTFGLTFLAIMGELVTKNGIIAVIGRYTLNPATASYRALIWDYGSESVKKHPWFGIAFSDYERPDWMIGSVDNHWLLLAIRHGIFVPMMVGLVVVIAMMGLMRLNKMTEGRDRKLYLALAISLFSASFTGFTVAFFGGPLTWYLILLGMGMSLGTMASRSARQRPANALART